MQERENAPVYRVTQKPHVTAKTRSRAESLVSGQIGPTRAQRQGQCSQSFPTRRLPYLNEIKCCPHGMAIIRCQLHEIPSHNEFACVSGWHGRFDKASIAEG